MARPWAEPLRPSAGPNFQGIPLFLLTMALPSYSFPGADESNSSTEKLKPTTGYGCGAWVSMLQSYPVANFF